jgi:hypothetical protein
MGFFPSLLSILPLLISSSLAAPFNHSLAATFNHSLAVPPSSAAPPPSLGDDFADPSIIYTQSWWFAYSSSWGGYHIPVSLSLDFNSWSRNNQDALPNLPGWVEPGPDLWAPDVSQLVGSSRRINDPLSLIGNRMTEAM